jgi:hypothetical protein
MRAVDEPIPLDEPLFRSIAIKDVDGDRIDPTSIELPAMSVARSKYCSKPEAALRHDDSGVAVTTSADLPPPMFSPSGIDHRFRAVDAPEEGDDHAEIRLFRGSLYNRTYKVNDKPFKLQLRKSLANAFRVLVPPSS